jgi:REP element-mobilizing transposase RayT
MTDMDSDQNKRKTDRRRNSFHLVFVPKYRYRIFRKPETKDFAEKVFRGIALEYGMEIHAMEVMPDHVHIFVNLPAKMCI